MDGVIFIRKLTEQEEQILEDFKTQKSISANTKAIQRIITEYDRLKKNEENLQKKVNDLTEKIWELQNEAEDYEEFFTLFKKLSKSKKS